MQEMSHDVTAVLLAETFLAFDNVAYVLIGMYVRYVPAVLYCTLQVHEYVRTQCTSSIVEHSYRLYRYMSTYVPILRTCCTVCTVLYWYMSMYVPIVLAVAYCKGDTGT